MTELETQLLESLQSLQKQHEEHTNSMLNDFRNLLAERDESLKRLTLQVNGLSSQLTKQQSDNQRLAEALKLLNAQLTELAAS